MDQFEPEQKIAEGTTAESFVARSQKGDRVLLRVLRKDVVQNPELVERFFKAAKVYETLDDPGIMRHLGAGRLADGRLYLATEYLVGDTLAGRLARGPITSAMLARIAIVLCRALDQMHRAKLLYRDLTPESVVMAGARPKLRDAGMSMFQNSTAVDLAPEVIKGAAPDPRSDLYALGCLFHQALTGVPLFEAPTREEQRQRHLSEEPPPVPGLLGGIVMRCLAKDPARRFATAVEVAAAIDGTLTGITAPSQQRQKPGDRLGAYELVRPLGEGSIGTVYEARHVKLDRRVAIKVLKPENVTNRTTLARFFNEARAVNQINHPHIVEVSDFVDEEVGSPVYCVMELLSGQTLREALAAGPVTLERTQKIVAQVCDALSAAHATGVIHRDLKPDNIFLVKRGPQTDYVKILDFGVAKLAKGSTLAGQPTTGTQEGAIVGTPTHMAPEQVVGDEVDARTDVYALGTVMFQLLSGHLPFEEQDFAKLAMQVIKKPAPPLPDKNPAGEDVPEAVRALVAKCLQKEPEQRPASVAEVAQAMVTPAPAVAPVEIDLVVESRPPRPKKSPVALIAGGLAFAVLAAVAIFFATRREPAVTVPTPPPTQAAPATITLTIVSNPRGATVVDATTKEQLGVTPLSKSFAKGDGELKLRLQLIGFLPAESSVKLTADALVDVPLVADTELELPSKTSTTKPKKKKINANGIIDPFAR